MAGMNVDEIAKMFRVLFKLCSMDTTAGRDFLAL